MFSRKKRSASNPPPRQQQQPPNVSSAASVAASAAFLNTQQRNRNNSLSSAAAAAALRSATSSPVPVGDIRTKRMIRRDSNSSVTSAGQGFQRQPFSSGLQRRGSSSSMTERSFRSPSPGRTNGVPTVPEIPSEPVPPVPPIPSRSARRTSSSSDMPSPRLDTSVASAQTAENTGKKRAPRPASVMSNDYFQAAQGSPTGQSSPRNINFSRPMSPGPGTTTSPRGSAPFHTGPQVNLQARPASTLGFTRDRDQAAARLSNPAAAAAKATAASTKPATSTGPTPEQIRAYQARAASLLARPRAQEDGEPIYRPPPSAPSSKANRTSSLLNPNTSTTARPAQQKSPNAQPPRPSSAASHSRTGSQPVNKSSSPASIARSLSVSPARSARFSDTPITEGIKHQPSLRAISPFKSALKSSSRPQSPSLKAPGGSVAGSETGSVFSDDGSVTARIKKNARVSFDERPIAVGESAAGLPAGSTNQRGPGFKDEEYTGMGGAPVLPSFGSVRGAKSSIEPATSGIHTTAASIFKEPTDEDDEAAASALGAPAISVQPATPIPDESARKQLESPRSSGEIEPGRPSLEEMMSAEGYTDVAKSRPIESPPSSPSKATFASASPSSNSAPHTSEEPRLSSDFDGEDSDLDGDQEYSDAAEDQSELEDRGAFASLDAIIESPQAEILEEPPVSPSASRTVFKEATSFDPAAQHSTAAPIGLAIGSVEMPSTEDEDWEKVRAYWSGLSEQSKQQIEAAATPLPAKELGAAATTGSKTGSKKKRDGTAKQMPDTVPLPPWPDREYQEQAVQQRESQENVRSPMRKSMRGAEKPSPRAAQPPAPRPKIDKPPPLGTVTPSATTAKAIAQAIAARQGKPSLTRSDSVGSDSSFKKSRKAKNGETKYTMRTSMRNQNPNGKTSAATKRETRPMSPEMNPRPTMRTSMRRNSVSSMESNQSTSRFSLFGRSSSKSRAPAPKASKSTKKSGSRFASRFDDSDSEEEDAGHSAFRSRFADSDDSDDERPTRTSKLTPVRGIPRRNGQVSGDSTDLEDSDVEGADDRPNAMPTGTNVSAPAPATTDTELAKSEGNALTAGTLRDNNIQEKRKSRSFFGLGRKKKTAETGSEVGSLPTSPVAATAPRIEDPAPASPGANDRPLTPPSAAGLTNGQVPMTPPSAQAAAAYTPNTGFSPVTPRREERKRSSSRASSIFRRWSASAPTSPAQTPEQNGGFPGLGSTPAVPAIPAEYKLSPAPTGRNGPRPITSDGVGLAAGSMRPPLGAKRDSTMTAPESGTGTVNGEKKVIYSMRTGKKKKFQGLRRRLGIDD